MHYALVVNRVRFTLAHSRLTPRLSPRERWHRPPREYGPPSLFLLVSGTLSHFLFSGEYASLYIDTVGIVARPYWVPFLVGCRGSSLAGASLGRFFDVRSNETTLRIASQRALCNDFVSLFCMPSYQWKGRKRKLVTEITAVADNGCVRRCRRADRDIDRFAEMSQTTRSAASS